MNTDPTTNQLLDDTEQLVGNDEDADRNLAHGMILETHTLLPGVLKSYNNDLQTAVCQPAIRRLITATGKMVALPLCLDVPVFFPGGVLTFDVAPGDAVVLAFSERCIDSWWAAGGVQDPVDLRNHDLSDAFALIGFQPRPSALNDVSQAGPELRTRDGSNRLAVRKDGTVHIGASASTSLLVPLTNGVVLGQGVDTLTELPFGVLGDVSFNVMAKP
jgi:hypothetical protein